MCGSGLLNVGSLNSGEKCAVKSKDIELTQKLHSNQPVSLASVEQELMIYLT